MICQDLEQAETSLVKEEAAVCIDYVVFKSIGEVNGFGFGQARFPEKCLREMGGGGAVQRGVGVLPSEDGLFVLSMKLPGKFVFLH